MNHILYRLFFGIFFTGASVYCSFHYTDQLLSSIYFVESVIIFSISGAVFEVKAEISEQKRNEEIRRRTTRQIR